MGSLTGDRKFTGAYAADSSNSGRGQIQSSAFNLISYVVDSSTTAFIEQDNSQLGIGAFQLQNAKAMSNLAASHLAVLRLKTGAKGAFKNALQSR